MKQWIVTARYKSEKPIFPIKTYVHSGKFQWIISCENGITAMNKIIERTKNYVPSSAAWSVRRKY